MEINHSFWKNKHICVTGHTGFKGSWLSLWLIILGAKVSGLSLDPETNPNMFDILNLSTLINDVRGDIRDIDICKNIMKDHSPDILIHMAAQPLVRDSYARPVYTYETNVMGTIHILEAARNCDSLKTIVVVTSDKCYENTEKSYAYKETDPMGGYDPYSSSKGCAEIVTAAYRRSFFQNRNIGVATVRAGNVIGGGDWSSDRLIPDAVRAFCNGKELRIRNPNAIRPWQHVIEALSGYLLLCERLWEKPEVFSGGWNIGPEQDSVQSVKDVSNKIAKFWGVHAGWRLTNNKEPHEAILLQLNSDKAKNVLGWYPKWTWLEALEKTIAWYQEYVNNSSAIMDFTIKQISSYSKM